MTYKYEIKSQNFMPGHPNDCFLYTSWAILELTYFLLISYERHEEYSEEVQEEGILQPGGAVFHIAYDRTSKELNEETGLNTKVMVNSVFNKSFEDDIKDWIYFWIWLQHGNSRYMEVINRGVGIYPSDIDYILEKEATFWHNHGFWNSLNWEWTSIIEIWNWTEVYCSLDTLRYWVEKGLWWNTARNYVWADARTKYILSCLRIFNKDKDADIKWTDQENKWRDEAANIFISMQRKKNLIP